MECILLRDPDEEAPVLLIRSQILGVYVFHHSRAYSYSLEDSPNYLGRTPNQVEVSAKLIVYVSVPCSLQDREVYSSLN
ncbi:hypothetical protein D1872_288260 [compost metagenome]